MRIRVAIAVCLIVTLACVGVALARRPLVVASTDGTPLPAEIGATAVPTTICQPEETIPAGTTSIRVSLLLSPRLDSQDPLGAAAKLSMFSPDWEDWPKALRRARFDVTYNGQTVSIPATTGVGANRVDDRLGLADSTVWKAVFTKDLLVKTFTYTDLSPSVMLSYDAAAMSEAIAWRSASASFASTAASATRCWSTRLAVPYRP